MTLLQQIIRRATPELISIYTHPFNEQLKKGTLPPGQFYLYLKHDWRYLTAYSPALILVANRLKNPQHQEKLKQFAAGVLATEQQVQKKYLPQFHVYNFFNSPMIKKMPVIDDYIKHLQHHAQHSSVQVGSMCLFTCLETYKRIGQVMGIADANNIYADWINSYSDPSFIISVEEFTTIINELNSEVSCPQHQEQIASGFITSLKFELGFFNSVMGIKNHQPSPSFRC